MATEYTLINLDKKEKIYFPKVDVGLELRELAGSIVAGNIITWYLLHNLGDRISFISDYQHEQSLFGATYQPADLWAFPDVTHIVVQELLKAGILRDASRPEPRPNGEYEPKLRNAWDPDSTYYIR